MTTTKAKERTILTKKEKNEKEKSIDGVGIGIGLTLAALVLFVSTLFINPTNAWQIIGYSGALILGGAGICGTLFDLGKIHNRTSLENFGVSALLAALSAIILLAISAYEIFYSLRITLIILLAVLLLFSLIGLGMGISRIAFENSSINENKEGEASSKQRESEPSKMTTPERINLTVNLIIGLTTAGATIIASLIQS